MQKRVAFSSFLLITIFSGILFSSCRQHSDTDDTPAYPTLEQQRDAVNKKPKVKSPGLLDTVLLERMIYSLAADLCEGRSPGTAGHTRARDIITAEMRKIGTDSIGGSIFQKFTAQDINGSTEGVNIIGLVKGKSRPDKYIVITAHYDHLGKESNGIIFPGADDNASGVGGLLALAKYFQSSPHAYSLLFVALDREETGLQGAFNLVQYLHKRNILRRVVLNLNLDMIARSDKDELFVCGIRHYPQLKYIVDSVQSKVNVKLLMWHDDRGQNGDWTNQSDHLAFHEKGIPFIYLGVEDHADYHKPTDSPEKIQVPRYVENANAAMAFLMEIDNL